MPSPLPQPRNPQPSLPNCFEMRWSVHSCTHFFFQAWTRGQVWAEPANVQWKVGCGVGDWWSAAESAAGHRASLLSQDMWRSEAWDPARATTPPSTRSRTWTPVGPHWSKMNLNSLKPLNLRLVIIFITDRFFFPAFLFNKNIYRATLTTSHCAFPSINWRTSPPTGFNRG